MECPICHSENNKVIDSKSFKDKIRRRRQCSDCDARFFTEETIVTDGSRSVDATFDSMYALADTAKVLATASAIQVIALFNDLAERSSVGIFPFSQIPTLSVDDDTSVLDIYRDGVVIDDDPTSSDYLSVVGDMCIAPQHHDIICYYPEIDGIGALKADYNGERWCVYTPLTYTTKEIIIADGHWFITEAK